MFAALKTFHLLALVLGGAATLGTTIMLRSLRKSGHKGAPPAHIGIAGRMFAICGLVAILTLWITGLWMYLAAYGGLDLGVWFVVKMAMALIILGGAVFSNVMLARAARGGPAPNSKVMRINLLMVRVALVIAVITAVIVFT